MKTATKFSDRIRFNWGYWDGVDDYQKNRNPRDMTTHFDQIYAAGYKMGNDLAITNEEGTSSESAWHAYNG